jgi:hypothetical protein
MKQLALMGVLSVGTFLVFTTLTGCGEGSTAAAGNGPPARPLQTGQTACYGPNGNLIECAGTGQDGALQAGVARRYVDNGDGTITDASTGLTWEKKSRDGSLHDWNTGYTWSDAFAAFIAGLNSARFAGYTDWRLPNINELQTLVDYGRASLMIDPAFNTNCVANCTVLTCSCTTPGAAYWSSTTVTGPLGGVNGSAWFVDFTNGVGVGKTPKGEGYDFVRAVRGGL